MHRRGFMLVGTLSLLSQGCGYMVGHTFRREVRTVYVPTFENETYRRGIEQQVTYAVQRQIGQRSPYKLSKGPEADTRLIGRIVAVNKNVLGETGNDDPRQIELGLAVHVTWEDQRSGQVLAQDEMPLPSQSLPVGVNADIAPEVGQSLASGTQDAVDQLARKIVNLMEAPW